MIGVCHTQNFSLFLLHSLPFSWASIAHTRTYLSHSLICTDTHTHTHTHTLIPLTPSPQSKRAVQSQGHFYRTFAYLEDKALQQGYAVLLRGIVNSICKIYIKNCSESVRCGVLWLCNVSFYMSVCVWLSARVLFSFYVL